MKKNYSVLFALVNLFLGFQIKITAQCSTSITAYPGANGNYGFYSTSTGTTMGTTYQWNFGDGNTGSGLSPNNTYTANGTYNVSVLITSPGPPTCTATSSQTIFVSNVTGCTLTANFSSILTPGGTVNFSSTSSGTIAASTYTWDYGDGSTGSGISSSHTYSANGIYPVSLTVDNGGGCTHSMWSWITVNNLPCNIIASFSYTLGNNGSVTFSSTSTGTAVNSTTYFWKNGNSQFAAGSTAANVFANGTHTITLVVQTSTANPVCIDSISQVITVTSVTCSLNASISFTQGVNGNVNFQGIATGTNSGTIYSWNFGDGTILNGTSTVSHSYSSSGMYNVTFTAQDSNAPTCSVTAVAGVNVNTAPCNANSNFTLTQLSPGNWQATPAYPWNVITATWDWGDNTTSNNLITSHTYSASGNYNICLTVSVTCNNTSTTCANYFITRSISTLTQSMITVNVVMPQNVVTQLSDLNTSASIFLYPNPANNWLKIISDNNYGSAWIEIYTISGQLVYRNSIREAGTVIDIEALHTGLYFVKWQSDKLSVTRKLVVEK